MFLRSCQVPESSRFLRFGGLRLRFALRDPVLALPVVASAIFASRGTPCPVIVCESLAFARLLPLRDFRELSGIFKLPAILEFSVPSCADID